VLAVSKQSRIAVDEFTSVKERIRIHSSLEVSLHKDKLDDTPRVAAGISMNFKMQKVYT
jgi:hypothetical protein